MVDFKNGDIRKLTISSEESVFDTKNYTFRLKRAHTCEGAKSTYELLKFKNYVKECTLKITTTGIILKIE